MRGRARSTARSRRRPSAQLGQAWTPGSAVFQYDNDQRADDDVVPRPHARDDARQRLRRAGRASTCCAAGPTTRSSGPSRVRRRRSATRRDSTTSRSRSRSRTAPSTRTARCSTPTTAPSSRASTRPSCRSRSRPTRPATGRATSRRSGTPSSSATRSSSTARTWPSLEVAAAALSLPLPERLQLPLPDPADGQRPAVLADRQRGRLPAGAGRAVRAAARPGGARRRDRRLHGRPGRNRDHPARTSPPTSRSAAASPGVDFEPADPETTGQVMRFRVVPATAPDPSTPPNQLVLPALAAARRRHQHAPGVAQRAGLGDGARAHRRARQRRPRLRERRAVRTGRGRPGNAQPGRHRQPARLGRADHGEPGAGSDRGVGDLQLHRRRPPDPHPRGHLRGRRPRADRRRRDRGPRRAGRPAARTR